VEAVEELTRVTTLYESEEQALEVSLARLWLAAAFLANGMRDAGIDQIHQVNGQLKIFKESGQVYLHVAQVARWFDSVRNQDAVTQKLLSASTHYMEKLPEVRRGLREVSRLVAVSPPSLDIHGFGPAQVYLNGNLVAISDWQTRETRDLFYYFLQSTSATKEEIGMIFWPDISPARLKMRFKTNLYRLRHAVGQDTILFDGERYRFNREGEYRYDVFHFEDLIKKEQVNNGQTPDQTIAYLQAAVDLVTGAYLADLDADWVYAQRSHYEELYLSTLMKLGHLYLKAGKAERTIETCNRAITADPLHEEAYRLNMQAFAALGDIAAIARQYQECLDVFQDELGADPSRETSQLYRKLTR
jgi:two-component SAPR family response regulator